MYLRQFIKEFLLQRNILEFLTKRFLLLFYLLVVIQKVSYSQSNSTNFNSILSRVEFVRKNRPVENVYIHFDKPYYVSGDTIYFKTYVTFNELHKPTPLSEVVHVDLIGPENNIINSVKLKLKRGTAYGDFELADSLPAGLYRIRAFTRWMLNDENASIFNQMVTVVSANQFSQIKVVSINDSRIGKPDIQFFPEGGELLMGVETKVAFKAIGNNGMGIKVKGVVVDNNGKEITRFQSSHLGMGFFYLRPDDGKSYSTKLTFSDGSSTIAVLPNANLAGIVLSADNEAQDTAVITVLATKEYFKEHQNEDITLLIYSGGIPLMARAKLDSERIDFAIDKRPLHSGIMRATLFSSQSEPLSERLLFVMNRDQLNLNLKSEKDIYSKHEKIEINLQAKSQTNNPVQGDFSAAVVNEDILMTDDDKATSIITNLLLTSELNGYVEQPNYYFTHPGNEVPENLDLLMMTQGYRHLLWKQIISDSLIPLRYKAESFFQIQGSVKSISGKPARNEKITLRDAAGQGPELKETTDSSGHFVFRNLDFSKTVHFTITASKNTSRIILDGEPLPMINQSDINEILSYSDSNMNNYLKTVAGDQKFRNEKNVKVLKTVIVPGKKSEDNYQTESLAGSGHADQVMHGSELKGGGSLSEQLNGRLHGVIFVNGIPLQSLNIEANGKDKPTPMMILLDGVQMYSPNINDINSAEIETIEVLRSGNASMYGFSGSGGVLVITTKRPKEIKVENALDSNSLQIAMTGFYKAKEFYSPKYQATDTSIIEKDLRTTVFWKPDVITDKNGEASISFYNNDLSGNYKVVIEGIDENGDIGRKIYRYQVR